MSADLPDRIEVDRELYGELLSASFLAAHRLIRSSSTNDVMAGRVLLIILQDIRAETGHCPKCGSAPGTLGQESSAWHQSHCGTDDDPQAQS